jgi:DNA-binding winged helix-turn-helix (wHTH) protein
MLLAFASYRFDTHSYTLYEGDTLIPLTSKAAQVLALLLERPGEVVTKEEFLAKVWKDTFVEPRSLTQCIFLLRKALDDQESQTLIETVAKRGYRFAAPVTPIEPSPAFPAPPPPQHPGALQQSPPRPHRVHWLWAALPMLLAGMFAAYWLARPALQPLLGYSSGVRLTWSETAAEPDIAPDGSFTVFASEDPATSKYGIYRQDLPSGFPRPITPLYPEPVESPAISPDGKRVAFRSSAGDGSILIVPADGSAPPATLPDSSRGRQPRWQPGRNALAYWVASEEHIRDMGIVLLQTVDPPGKPVRVFDGFDTAYAPLWEPGGSALLALGTAQSAVPDREFDAWVNPFRNGVSAATEIRTGLFDLLRSSRLYSTVRDRVRIAVTGWHSGYLYLSILQGHAANLYRVPIGADYHVYGEPEPLTATTQLLLAPRVSSAGDIVTASTALLQSPWRMTLDGRTLERLPVEAGWLSRMSISSAGDAFAAEIYAAGSPIRILAAPLSGGARVVASGSVAFPVITPQGDRVAYRIMDGRKQAVDLVSFTGGPPHRICDDCGAPEEWTPAADYLLYHTGGAPARIGVVEAATGMWHDLIIHPDYGVFGPRLHVNAAGQGWIAFYAENTPRTCQIFVAPLKAWQPPPVSTWIPITNGALWDSSPAWSPSGQSLFFVSLRDGHRCIYEQPLDPSSRRPLGQPRAVRHLHSTSLRLGGVNRARGATSLRQAAASLFFIPDAVVSDAWLLRPSHRH